MAYSVWKNLLLIFQVVKIIGGEGAKRYVCHPIIDAFTELRVKNEEISNIFTEALSIAEKDPNYS